MPISVPTIVTKPWGHEEIWAHTADYAAKLLFIRDGHRLSLQYHVQKAESVRVVAGRLTLVLGNDTLVLGPGECADIPRGMVHRMEARDGDVTVAEVSTPQLDDVVRLGDDYARGGA